MYVRKKVCNHFLNLIDEECLAMNYFSSKNIVSFNNAKLQKLKSDLRKAKFNYNKLFAIFIFVETLGIEDSFFDLALKTEKARKAKCRCEYDLEIFESNLAYLIISNIIKVENCVSLGFDLKYINELLNSYKKYLDNPYVEYDYDENTGRTSQIMKDGRRLILSYTPTAIKNKISEYKGGKIRH